MRECRHASAAQLPRIYLVRLFEKSRRCPKRDPHGTREAAFGTFGSRYPGQIRARRPARTPFRTVSSGGSASENLPFRHFEGVRGAAGVAHDREPVDA
jgi:hypothetical protein